MQQFTIILKDNTQKAFNSFFWFLFFLHLVAAAVFSMSFNEAQHTIALVAIALFFAIAALLILFKAQSRIYHMLLFTSMVVFWLLLSAWLPAIVVMLIIVFAYRILKVKSNASVTPENIVITRSLFKRVYSWDQIENIVLKDHLLSIDLKSNQLIQTEIAVESYTVDEAAFNEFCRHQLKTLNSKL
jgi:hypothetical protein